LAISHHYDPCWLRLVPRNGKNHYEATFETYQPFTEFCRQCAYELTSSSGREWTPRDVDMALWGIGKRV
jgi:hypothetical protein